MNDKFRASGWVDLNVARDFPDGSPFLIRWKNSARREAEGKPFVYGSTIWSANPRSLKDGKWDEGTQFLRLDTIDAERISIEKEIDGLKNLLSDAKQLRKLGAQIENGSDHRHVPMYNLEADSIIERIDAALKPQGSNDVCNSK